MDAVVGTYGRAQFIREAIEAKLFLITGEATAPKAVPPAAAKLNPPAKLRAESTPQAKPGKR
jgi:hypothetical protein